MYEYGEPDWNDTDKGKPKNLERNLFMEIPVYTENHTIHMTTKCIVTDW
jgi:hypothetical protein